MTTTTIPPKTVRIGIISGSTRVVRVGPQIAAFVRSLIEKDLKTSPVEGLQIEFEDIDVGSLNLPLFDEPIIPSHTDIPDGYTHEHTRTWSRRISALDAFVFVTSQHNWGVPAGLKNAIDYLYKEWKGKPYVVVSYGGHGGGHAAKALEVILGGGLKMRGVDGGAVNLSFPSCDVLHKSIRGDDLRLLPSAEAAAEETWSDRTEDIVQLWRKMAVLLTTPVEEKQKPVA
ncbi:hypothetical protein SBRCBS47491_004409 [Sporothrix bragantina]|uniref:NADPH-dependent FMN reductase-like domain-containing protein n=1 Tax=Sporothrix bragantina TaxID=671064 RepID=A0ABP0BPW2_9PEZI